MPKLKILCILPTPPPFAGPEIGSHLLLNSKLSELCELIHLPSNIRDNNRDKGKKDLRSVIRLIGLCSKQILLSWRNKPQITYTLLSQNKSGFIRDACYIFLAKMMGQKVVAHFRGGNFDVFYAGAGWFWKRVIAKVLRQVDWVVVQAERLRYLFEPLVPPDRIRVIYNGIDTSFFSPKANLRDGDFSVRILFIGHLSIAKGFGDLLDAIPIIVREQPNTEFLIVGERFLKERNILVNRQGTSMSLSGLEEQLQNIESESHLRDRIRFLGTVYGEEKERVFAEADIFVLPSYAEGFPLSILEAMAAGLPVVCTPVGAVPEVVEEGKNGVFVTPGRSEELAEAILSLVKDNVFREQMGAANRARAKEKFDINKIAESLFGLFRDVENT